MKITLVLGPFLPIPPILGGAVEKVQFLLAGAYRAAGHEVTIISRRYGNFAREEVVDGIRHIRIASFDSSSSLAGNLILDLCYALRVARRLPQSDITVTNSFSLPLVLPGRRAGKIYVHVARFPKGQMALYWRADRLQAISRAVADAIARQAPWLAGRVAMIGFPLPEAYFRNPGAARRTRTILYVGRIAREKGVDLLIKAFASAAKNDRTFSDWRLRIVGPHEVTQGGDGAEYLGQLAALARPLGGACEFVPPVFDQDALIEVYRSASVFVYPSLAETGEAFGLAPLEAMAAGCAVVVSDLRCFDDFVEDGVTGLKFDHRVSMPEINLADVLSRLIGNPDVLVRIAEAGHRAAARFRLAEISGRMLADFAALLGPRPGQTSVA
jgi:glycosyltransferase involved in cell wall biosynthesis